MVGYNDRKVAGTLLSIGGLQWFFSIVITEGLHPGFIIGNANEWIPYSSKIHYISELGVGPTALPFNSSLLLLGLMVMAASYFLQRQFNSRLFSIFMAITGIGAMGVAIFPTTVQPIHGIFQAFALLFGAVSAIISYRMQKSPLTYISIFLGGLSLIALVVFYPYLGLGVGDTVTYLELGKGAMERLVIYPILMWIIGFGYYLITNTKD